MVACDTVILGAERLAYERSIMRVIDPWEETVALRMGETAFDYDFSALRACKTS